MLDLGVNPHVPEFLNSLLKLEQLSFLVNCTLELLVELIDLFTLQFHHIQAVKQSIFLREQAEQVYVRHKSLNKDLFNATQLPLLKSTQPTILRSIQLTLGES